jgi:hypothetical protein
MRGETVMGVVSKLHLLGDAAGNPGDGRFGANPFQQPSEGASRLVTQQVDVATWNAFQKCVYETSACGVGV